MKANHISIPLLSLMTLIFIGCGHTNELAHYKIAQEKCLFRYFVDPAAARVRIVVINPTPSKAPIVGDILAGLGSDILSSEAQKKLDQAIRPEGVAAAISTGIEQFMKTYLSIISVPVLENEPDYLVETFLEQCELSSGPTGIYLHMKAETSMFDRRTGKIIWNYDEDTFVPVRETIAGALPFPEVGAAASIYNAAHFFRLSEKEMQDVIFASAKHLGEIIGRVMREDYSESR